MDTTASTNAKRPVTCSSCHLVGHNKRTCPTASVPATAATQTTNATPSAPVSVPADQNTANVSSASGQQQLCGHCQLPLGEDHRLCICEGYNYSVEAWRAALIPSSNQASAQAHTSAKPHPNVTVRPKKPIQLPKYFLIRVIEDNGDDITDAYCVVSSMEAVHKEITKIANNLYEDFIEDSDAPLPVIPSLDEMKEMFIKAGRYRAATIMQGGEDINNSALYGYEIQLSAVTVDGV
jgi:hypothetical protein